MLKFFALLAIAFACVLVVAWGQIVQADYIAALEARVDRQDEVIQAGYDLHHCQRETIAALKAWVDFLRSSPEPEDGEILAVESDCLD